MTTKRQNPNLIKKPAWRYLASDGRQLLFYFDKLRGFWQFQSPAKNNQGVRFASKPLSNYDLMLYLIESGAPADVLKSAAAFVRQIDQASRDGIARLGLFTGELP